MSIEPLQTDEVVKVLTEWGDCLIIHVPTGESVHVYYDSDNERSPWKIVYEHFEILDKAVLREILALDLELCAHNGLAETRYELYRHCFGVTAAAIKALKVARFLPEVPTDAWLWITVANPDLLDSTPEPPEPPVPWPPAAV